MPLLFEDAAKAKDAIMASQQKEIQKLYDEWADDVLDKAIFYSHKTNASAALSEKYYKELFKQMNAQSNQIGKEVQGIITSNMYTIADAMVASNVNWLKSFGFSEEGLNAAFSHIPHDVVQRLITGQIYQGGWNLSQRIWSDNQQTQRDIYQIMAKGLAEQKSVYEIAKDLESYVRPGAKLPWNPVLAMRNTKTGQIEHKRIYKKQVDYNAQRLARTLAQHSYQQSFITTTQKNPFITEYVWHSNGSRVCDLCKSRDGAHYSKNDLPMDHPNGMCTMEPVVVKDMVDQLADWFNSPDGTYPEIDAFAGNFGYNAAKGGTVQDFISKYGTSTKSPNAWFNSLTPVQKAEAKLLKEQSGLTWNEWYKQNVYIGDGSNLVKKAAAKTSDVFDAAKWYDTIRKNDLREMNKWTDEWLKKITYLEKDGVVTYTGHAYKNINNYLRGMSSTTRYADEIKAIKAALSKASLPREVIVRRGSYYNMLDELGLGTITRDNVKDVIGAIVTDKGFVSTSPSPHGGFSGSIEYIIRLPKGSQAMYVDSISYFQGEEELLINAGGKYIIEGVEFDSYGDITKIYMTLKNLQ